MPKYKFGDSPKKADFSGRSTSKYANDPGYAEFYDKWSGTGGTTDEEIDKMWEYKKATS